MKTYISAAAVGIVLAVIASFATNGGYGFYRFYAHGIQREQESVAVMNTIKFFGGNIAGFYATDGNLDGLNTFPAEKMVKRRLFHDIRNWEANGKLLVLDRDTRSFRNVIFPAPDVALVVTDENWFSVFQDRVTRRPISEKNANMITVRYLVRKKWGRWIVEDYEVFKQGSKLPPMRIARILK